MGEINTSEVNNMENRVSKRMYVHRHNYIVAVKKDGNEPPKIFMNYPEEKLYEANYAIIKHCDSSDEAKQVYDNYIEQSVTYMVVQSQNSARIVLHYGTEYKAPTGSVLKGLFKEKSAADLFLKELQEKIKTA